MAISVHSTVLTNATPSLSLFLSKSVPIGLTLHSTIISLARFSAFSRMSKEFLRRSVAPFQCGSNICTLPVSRSFGVVFIHASVFRRLRLRVPRA